MTADVYDDRPYEQDGRLWRLVRCHGCGVPIGYAVDAGLRSGVHCSTWCVWEYSIRGGPASRLTPREAIRDAWYWLFQAGHTPNRIAGVYGIDNDFRVHKALRSRRLDDESRAVQGKGARVVVGRRFGGDGG